VTTYRIEPTTTALLLVDAQREYFDADGLLHTPHAAAIEANLVALRDAARTAGVLTVYVQHVHRPSGLDVGRMGDFDDDDGDAAFTEGTRGVEIIDSLAPGEDDLVVTKRRYSAFVHTELSALLRGNGIDTVVIAGLMTQFCSVTTARHAHDLDYRVVFVADANAGPDLPDLGFGEVSHDEAKRVILTILAAGVADIQTTAEVVAALAD